MFNLTRYLWAAFGAEVIALLSFLVVFNWPINSPVEDFIFLSVGDKYEGVVIPRGFLNCIDRPRTGVLAECRVSLLSRTIELSAVVNRGNYPICDLSVNGSKTWCEISEGSDSYPTVAYTDSDIGFTDNELAALRSRYPLWNWPEGTYIYLIIGPAVILAVTSAVGIGSMGRGPKLVRLVGSIVGGLLGGIAVGYLALYGIIVALYPFLTVR